MFRQDVNLHFISEQSADARLKSPCGRWIGMLRVRGDGRMWLDRALEELDRRGDLDRLTIPDLLNYLVEQDKPVRVNYIHGHWLDVNSLDDIDRAGDFTKGRS